jgi:death-on-curing protein
MGRQSVRFLSAEQVLLLHEALLLHWGGSEGSGHRGVAYEGVDAAVQAVKNSYYDTVEELAAAYAVYIVQGHVFLDGNKRTGSAAMMTFLFANRARVSLPTRELASRMLELQRRSEFGEDAASLVGWLAQWLIERRAPPKKRRRRRR